MEETSGASLRIVLAASRGDEVVARAEGYPRLVSGPVAGAEGLAAAAERLAREIAGAAIVGAGVAYVRRDAEGVVIGVFAQLASDPGELREPWALRPRSDVRAGAEGDDLALLDAERGGIAIVDGDTRLPVAWGRPAFVAPPVEARPAPRPIEPIVIEPSPPSVPAFRRYVAAPFGAGCIAGGGFMWLLGILVRLDRLGAKHGEILGAGTIGFLVLWAVATVFGFREPAPNAKRFFGRSIGVLAFGVPVAFLGLAFLGGLLRISERDVTLPAAILGGIVALAARWLAGRPRERDPMIRVALASGWITLAFITLWSLSDGFRKAVRVRGPESDAPIEGE